MELPKFIFQATENLVEKPWGGEWIAMLKGFRKKGIGESWEFSAHHSNTSQVLLRGETTKLTELFIEKREEILGSLAEKHKSFPILLKIVEVIGKRIPIVHPSEKVAENLGIGDGGKLKAWIMISGRAYIGFSEDVPSEEIDAILTEEKIWEKMNKFDASSYDSLLIPPGTIHSAENARFIEVGTNAEATIELRDDRIKRALSFKKTEDFEIRTRKNRVETEFFVAEILEIVGKQDFTIDTFNVLLSLEGYLILRSEKEIVDLPKGYSCLIPAKTGSYSVQSEKAKILRVYPR
ncbi:MAG: hypothetical protein ACK401_04340 [Archaeoglobaceae archaeon]